MQISVINVTTGSDIVSRAEAIKVVRAINRQLREDFFPYWHIHGQLRLDPETAEPGSATKRHEALRGDGILYLMTSPSQTQMLGYHERHFEGVPFGFVFTDVSKKVGEHWSVTLSHEAIELIADPDVNLLCKGPHPDPRERGRDVFHWFELCDAVQAESYEIDGTLVSNFVLPAYFTSAEERGGHNDFLSMASATQPPRLLSYGTNPGGYAGFYDPQSRTDENYRDPRVEPGKDAARRADVKQHMVGSAELPTRRKDRRPLRNPCGVGLEASAQETVVDATTPAELESLAFRVVAGPQERPIEVARAVIADLGGPGWQVQPFWDQAFDFEARPADAERALLTLPRAWELTYDLRSHPRVAKADPLFMVRPSGAAESGPRLSRGSGQDEAPLLAARQDCEWSLKQVNAKQAWARSQPASRQGAGILIGHPDTGYSLHPEIADRFSLDHSVDFVDGGPALDSLESGLLLQPSHGTSTASVIASPDGSQRNRTEFVSGVAPGAKIIPIRVSRSVVHLSTGAITKAIRHACQANCHVISMSLGSPFGFAFLHDAVRDACNDGVIVLAAAGNEVRFVVYPAAFDEVIAVAASNVELRPWKGSSRGSAVDITAPGESVWRARTAKSPPEGFLYDVAMGSGTSYAVATVAGIAALWLAHHGRQALIARYGKPGLPVVFKQLLLQTCQRPGGWDSSRYGAGIADADALLAAPLPQAIPARGMRGVRGATGQAVDGGPFRKLQHFYEDSPPLAVRAAIGALLATPDEELDAKLEVVADELAMQLAVDDALREELNRIIKQATDGEQLSLRAAARGSRQVTTPALATARALLGQRASSRLRPQ